MIALFIYVRVSIWVSGFYKLEALGVLMAPLSFNLHIIAKLLCFCLVCLTQSLIYMSMAFSSESESGPTCNKCLNLNL